MYTYSRYDHIFRQFSISGKPSREQLAPLPAPPPPKRPIGHRGNHEHKKILYDPVYPKSKVPSALVPRFPIDWRNAGRFIICSAMAKLEGKRLYNHSQSLRFQSKTHCGTACGIVCRHSSYRCLCVWRSKDSVLNSFKGPIYTKSPLFTTPYLVARKNTEKSNALTKGDDDKFNIIKKTYRYNQFNDREKFNTSVFKDVPCYEEERDEVFDVRHTPLPPQGH